MIFGSLSITFISLPLYKYLSVIINNLGFIWENLSTTPFVPKSGEQDDQIAPTAEVAIKLSTVSI